MGEGTWTVAQAKAKFSEVIDLAQSRGPQTVTRNGRTVVVVVAAKEWEREDQTQRQSCGVLCCLSAAWIPFENQASSGSRT